MVFLYGFILVLFVGAMQFEKTCQSEKWLQKMCVGGKSWTCSCLYECSCFENLVQGNCLDVMCFVCVCVSFTVQSFFTSFN